MTGQKKWVKNYNRYPNSLKRKVAKSYLKGEASYDVLAEENGLRDKTVVKEFVKWYRRKIAEEPKMNCKTYSAFYLTVKFFQDDTENISFLPHRKHPRNIEPKMNISIKPTAHRFRNIALFNHRSWIGKMQLENMTTSFNIETNGKRISVAIGELIG